MAYNEDTRVKIPAILHLQKLGYNYLSLSDHKIDQSTNIFVDVFNESILKLNPDLSKSDIREPLKIRF